MDVLRIIFLIASFVVAFFIGGHIYKKYGALLTVWKKCVIPISLLVEPYIYIYRFDTITKPNCRRYRIKVIVAFVICVLLYPQVIGIGFSLGYLFQYILWLKRIRFSEVAVAKIFADYVIPGKEEFLAREIASFYAREITGFTFRE